MRNFTFNKNSSYYLFFAKREMFLVFAIFFISSFTFGQTTVPFTTAGTTSWNVPANVTTVEIQCWGGGGGGSRITSLSGRGGGGGGGAFASGFITVIPSSSYSIVVGGGGATNTAGGNSSFNTTSIVAAGGSGTADNSATAAAGGTVAASVGTIRFRGGNGANGGGTNSGGGGGGAGTGGQGGDANNATAGAGTAVSGGVGGAGRSGNTVGFQGVNYGGGGGGGVVNLSTTDRNGGGGAQGQVLVTYRIFTLTSTALSTPTCSGSGTTVTASAAVAANLPVGSYTVTYTISGTNTGSGSATMTVVAAGAGTTGTFTTTALANAGNTTITINNITLTGSYGSNVVANNAPSVTVEAPTVNAGAALTSICRDGTSAPLGGSIGGSATTGTWSDGGVGGDFLPNSTDLNATWKAPNTFVGTAVLTLTTSGGSCGTTSAFKNQVVTAPTPTFTTVPPAFTCLGTTTSTYTTQPGQSNYIWTIPGTDGVDYTLTGGTTTDNTTVITWLTLGSKTVTVNYTDGNGCTALNPVSNITTVSALPAIYTITGDATICEGTATDITVPSSENGVSYQLKNGAANVGTSVTGTGSSITLNTGALNSIGTTTFSVLATNTTSNCSETMSGTVSIIVEQAPTVSAGVDDNVCQTPTPSAITLSGATIGGSATTGTWSIFSGTGTLSDILPTANPELVTFTPDANYTGDVVLHLTTDAFGACSPVTGTRTIHVRPLPIVYNVGGGTTICEGTSTDITLSNSETNVTYQLRDALNSNANVGSPVVGTGGSINLPTGNLTNGTTFNIYATKSDGTGCNIEMNGTAAIVVTPAPSAPSAPTSPAATACGQTTLDAYTAIPGGQNYYWQGTTNNGTSTTLDASSDYGINTVGTFTYYVRAREGICWSVASASLPVTINSIPGITPSATMPSVCQGVTTATLAYSAPTNTPTRFSITYGAAALGQTFANVSNQTLGANIPIVIPAGAAPASYTATLTVGTANCVSVDYPITVDVKARPTPTFTSIVSTSVCQNSDVTYTTEASMTGYVWTFTGGTYTVQSGANTNSITIRWTNSGAGRTVSINYTGANGCAAASPTLSTAITVNAFPTPTFTAQPTIACVGGNVTYTTQGGMTNYVWGFSTAPATYSVISGGTSTDNSITLQWLTNGNKNVTVSYTDANLCAAGSASPSNVVNVSGLPATPGFSNPTPGNGASRCAGTELTFYTASASNYAWGIPGTAGVDYNITGGSVTSRQLDIVWLTPGSKTFTLNVANAAGCWAATPATRTITINEVPTVTNNNTAVCSGVAASIPLTATVASTYDWTRRTNTGSISGSNASANNVTSLNQTLTNPSSTTPGSIVYRITPTSNVGGCEGNYKDITVVVNPRPVITAATPAICNNTPVNFSPTVSTSSNLTWTISSNPAAITGASDPGAGATITDILTNGGNANGVITYTLTATSTPAGCVSNTANVAVTVRPTPVITNLGTSSICSGTSPSIALASNAASSYAWTIGTVTGSISGYSATSGTAINQTLINADDANDGSVEYVVTPTLTGTPACVGTPSSIVVTVHPRPTIAVANNVSVCSGDATNITLTPSTPGNLTWTAVNSAFVSNTADGTGNTIIQSPLNSDNTAGTVTYNVTSTNTTLGTCSNSSSVVVTVNPRPSITTPQTAIACGGDLFTVTPANSGGNIVPVLTDYAWGAPSGTGFSGGGSGTGTTSISGTLTNTTSGIVSALYSVTPTSSSVLGSCAGSPFDVSVTINPKPTISTITPTLCSGVAFSISPADITNGIVPSGTTYTWSAPTGSGFSGGVSGSGSTITGTLDNNTAGNTTAAYTVTPTAPLAVGGCEGAPFNIDVNLKPRPTATISPASDLICTGTAVNHLLAGTGGPIDSYLWNRPAVSSINGNIAALNQTSNPINEILNSGSSSNVVVTYSVAAVYDGCPGVFENYVVTVRPTSAIGPQKDTTCSNTPITLNYNDFTGVVPSDAYFTWNTPSMQPGVSGGTSNSVPSQTFVQTLINNTTGPLKANYVVTVTSATSCVSSFFNLEITVLPAVTISGLVGGSPASSLNAICSEEDIQEIELTSNIGTSVLSWTRDNTTNLIGMAANGTNIINGSLTNITSSTQIETFHLTATVAGCSANTTVTVSVKPKPIGTASPVSQLATCSDSTIQAITLSSSVSESPTVFNWHRNNNNLTGIGMTGSGNSITGSLSMINTSINTAQKDTFYIVPTTDGCIGDTITSVVEINPTPLLTVPAGLLSVCAGTAFPDINLSSSNTVAGTTYLWDRDNTTNIGGSVSGTGTPISEIFTNTTGVIEQTTLTIKALANGCYSAPQTKVIEVKPTPTLTYTATPATAVCSGTNFELDLDADLGAAYTFSTISGFTQNVDKYNGTLTNATTTNQIVTFTGYATAPSIIGSCVASVTVPVTVYAPLTTQLIIGESQNLCGTTNPTALSITSSNIGGRGDYTYQWRGTEDGVSWVNVGSNQNTYTPTRNDSSFQLIITDGLCGTVTSSNIADIVPTATAEPGALLGLTNAPSATYCNGGTYTATFLSGHGTGSSFRYTWASTTSNIVGTNPVANTPTGNTDRVYFIIFWIGNSSSGNIPLSFVNNGNATVRPLLSLYPRIYSYGLSPGSTTSGPYCVGNPDTFRISIFPTPKAAFSVASQTICSGGSPTATVHPLVTDVTSNLAWSVALPTGLTCTTPSGTLSSTTSVTNTSLGSLFGTFTNTTSAPITTTVTVYASANGCSNPTGFTFSLTVNPGIVSGAIPSETICSGSTPAVFKPSLNTLTGGTLSYYWQSGTGGCGGSFSNIGAATDDTLQATSITSSRSYRRITTFNNGVNCRDTTCVTINTNNVVAGTISANQNICNGEIPVFTNTLATSTSGSALSYQWESDNGSGYSDIGGATSDGYTPSTGLTTTTTFRRRVTAELNGNQCSVNSATITATVYTVSAGTIADPAPQCGIGNPAAITTLTAGTVSPSNATISYRWLVTDGGSCSGAVDWDTVGTNSQNYDPPTITTSKTYVRVAISNRTGKLCYDTTQCKTIDILNISSGSISANQSVCIGQPALAFTSTGPGTSAGAFTYQWQDSTASGTWQNISGAGLETYHYTDPVTESHWFRRVTSDLFPTINCDVPSNEVVLLVNNADAGILTVPSCTSTAPSFIEQQAANGPGTLTYQWQINTDNDCLTANWSDPGPGSTAAIYTPTVSEGTYYYRRIVTSDVIGNDCNDTTTCIVVHAYDGTIGTWRGIESQDWFNCANWGAGFIPDNTTPVNIPSVTFKPIIDRTSSFITTTDSIAHAANLDVNDLLTFANSKDSLFIGGNLTIDGDGSVVMTNGGNIELRGDWENNNGAAGFIQNSGNVSLTGTSAQQHIIEPQMFNRLRIDHTGTGITLDKDVIITDSIEFVNGKINTGASPNGLLTLSATAKASGASSNSFVNGPVAKETDSSPAGSVEFTFPIGKTLPSNNYQPAGILPVNHDGINTTTYIAEFIAADPSLLGYPFIGTTLTGILHDKYWEIDRVGNGTARVVLNYQPTVATTTGTGGWVDGGGSTNTVPPPNSTNVAVAHGDGFWDFTKSDGYFEVTTAPLEAIWYRSSGKVYSGEMLSFSPFTIGFGSNTLLPVKLLSFDGRILGTDGALSWKIADGSDLAGFELQYSADGITFRKLADVPANGGTVYSYLDKQLPIGARYYRLLIKEKSGNSLFSKLLVLTLDGQRTSIVGLANTIVREQQVTGKIISAKSQGVRALVSDVSGRQIKELRGHLQQGTNRWLIGTGFLAQGMYFVTIITEDGVKATLQFVKE